MSEDAVTIDGEESACVAGAGKEASVGSESKGIDNIFARRPKLIGSALRAYAVDAAREKRRKRDEWLLLRRNLSGTRCARGNGCRALRSGDDGGRSLPGAWLLANRGDVDGAVGGDGERSDFTSGSLVENEAFRFRCGGILGVLGGSLCGTPGDAQNASAGFRAGDEVAFCVECQNANVSFVAGVEEFALAVGRDSEDLPLVTGGDIESPIGRKSEVPDVFGFGIEEHGFLARRRNPVNLAVGRSADVKSAFGVKDNGLRGKVSGIEEDSRFAVRIEAKYFRRRPSGSVERALGIKADGPKIGSIRVGKQGDFRREFEAAVAAHRHAMGGAFEEIFVGGLAPAAGVLGEGGREAEDGKEVEDTNGAKDAQQACST